MKITKKREGFILEYNKQNNTYSETKFRINLPEIPYCISWQDKTIVISYLNREFSMISSEDMKVSTLPVPIGKFPLIKATKKDEFLLLS